MSVCVYIYKYISIYSKYIYIYISLYPCIAALCCFARCCEVTSVVLFMAPSCTQDHGAPTWPRAAAVANFLRAANILRSPKEKTKSAAFGNIHSGYRQTDRQSDRQTQTDRQIDNLDR